MSKSQLLRWSHYLDILKTIGMVAVWMFAGSFASAEIFVMLGSLTGADDQTIGVLMAIGLAVVMIELLVAMGCITMVFVLQAFIRTECKKLMIDPLDLEIELDQVDIKEIQERKERRLDENRRQNHILAQEPPRAT